MFKTALPAVLALFSATITVQAQVAPCAPSFRSLHAFKVGDVFQYRIWDSDLNWANIRVTETTRKYKVVSRRDSGSILIYGIEGASLTLESLKGRNVSRIYAPIREDLRFTDSTGHRLNKCKDDIIPYPETGITPPMVTQMGIHSADVNQFPLARPGQSLKVLGNPIGIVRNGTLNPIMDLTYTQIWAESLGLVKVAIGGGMAGLRHTEDLVAYIRDGQTFGVITPDEDLSVSIRNAAVRVLPDARPSNHGGPAFDLRGRRLLYPAMSRP